MEWYSAFMSLLHGRVQGGRIVMDEAVARDGAVNIEEGTEVGLALVRVGKVSDKIFISHQGRAERECGYPARKYRDKLGRDKAFLSSDWESIRSGEAWFTAILETIRGCSEFHVVVAKETGWRSCWMSFEFGVAVGAGKKITVVRKGKTDQGEDWEVREGSDTPLAEESRWRSFESADDWRKMATEVASRRYLAHDPCIGNRAVEFQSLCAAGGRPVTSREVDRHPLHRSLAETIFSLAAGQFYALLDRAKDSESPWLNYEIGVAVGRGLLPIVLVAGGFDMDAIANPLAGIHLVCTGDTNRMLHHFGVSGFLPDAKEEAENDWQKKFAPFFRQVGDQNP